MGTEYLAMLGRLRDDAKAKLTVLESDDEASEEDVHTARATLSAILEEIADPED